MIDSKKVLNDISNYAVYENSLKLEHGTDLQKIKDSASFYNMTLGSVKNTLDNGKTLYNSIPTNSPKVGLNLSIFWDFYSNEKTEFDKICLRCVTIKAGCFFSAIIFRPTIVFPEPGGATITPKSFFAIVSITIC